MIAHEEWEGAASELLDATCTTPPVDAFKLADACEMTVRPWSGRGAMWDGDTTIKLNMRARRERQHGQLAHELGHFALRRARIDDSEEGARWVGGALLLPRREFGRDLVETAWTLSRLRERHVNASAQMIAYRIVQLLGTQLHGELVDELEKAFLCERALVGHGDKCPRPRVDIGLDLGMDTCQRRRRGEHEGPSGAPRGVVEVEGVVDARGGSEAGMRRELHLEDPGRHASPRSPAGAPNPGRERRLAEGSNRRERLDRGPCGATDRNGGVMSLTMIGFFGGLAYVGLLAWAQAQLEAWAVRRYDQNVGRRSRRREGDS